MLLNVVEGLVDEPRELHLGDRPETIHCHPDRHPHDARLAQRRIQRALLTVGLQQPIGHAEDPTVQADILAQDDHAVILLHLLS